VAITDRIISWWALADNTDSHAAHDLTEVNTPIHNAAKVGDGMQVSLADDDYAYVPNASAADFQLGTRALSFAFWCKPTTLPTSGAALVYMGGNGASDAGYHVIYNNSAGTGQFLFRVADGTTFYTLTASGYPIDSWYHVAFVIDAANKYAHCYVNAARVGFISLAGIASVSSNDNLQIGGRYAAQTWFDGQIDEVVFYDGAMSGDIRQILYNGGSGIGYADFSAITRQYVQQEFVLTQETNTNHLEISVSNQQEGQVALAMITYDGNVTSKTITDWSTAWTSIFSAQSSTFVGSNAWWREVTAADESETLVEFDWTSNEKAVAILQLWDQCAGVDVSAASTVSSGTTSFTAPAVTTTVDNTRLVVGIGIDGGPTVTSPPSGVDFHDYRVALASGHVGKWIGGKTQASAGSTGTFSFTVSGSTLANTWTIAMLPGDGATVEGLASDGAKLGDTATSTLQALASALDGVKLGDVATVAKSLSAAASDGLSLSDVAQVVAIYALQASDGARFGDSAIANLLLHATATDGLVFSDGAVYPTDAAYVDATVTLAAAIAASVSLQAAIAASVTINPD
jgi:hypothetical protein